jgi:uncharacterized protein YciI
MLAFSWNAPPAIPRLREKGPQTQVVLRFEPLGDDRTKVLISHHDIGEGEDWDKYLAYFERAWDLVLSRLVQRFAPDAQLEMTASSSAADDMQQFAYFIRPAREEFFDQPTEFEQKVVSEHAGYVKRLLDGGTVFLAGRCFDPAHYPSTSAGAAPLQMPTPGIVLFKARDLEAAVRIMEADPAVRAGVFKAQLNAFRIAFSQD